LLAELTAAKNRQAVEKLALGEAYAVNDADIDWSGDDSIAEIHRGVDT
jgi:hypothetical protein